MIKWNDPICKDHFFLYDRDRGKGWRIAYFLLSLKDGQVDLCICECTIQFKSLLVKSLIGED
ncbi:hypothetical protein COE15_04925 [Bacillus cereus]|nr:hypothetical protein CN288_01925 [Bacillus sp. AFS023182]PGY04603.1 hypothetical protein COE15_04925 [Bacillus cereus]